MSSIISGFEYDIFVSYRHNDNRTGWVTEFVHQLEEELVATLKDPVTIYFDKNPHHGLLETHVVDKSLEGKLKCLIFIPIISQTYCDPKSFAWQHEFCAFNRLSQQDQFGRDVKLGNGNVASRILALKIHDLDAEDKSLLENELVSALRAMDFIFTSAGVNRPLRLDDKREDNLNRLVYRDQINKVANAIKDITNALRFPNRVDVPGNISKPVSEESSQSKPAPSVNNKSIAVLPFLNLAQDSSQEYFADGITENILIQLASLRHLRVISRTSIMRYKKTTKSAPEIAAELGVKYILEGSAQAHANKVRIQVQLIDAEKDDHVWSKSFVESMDDIFAIQSNVAEIVAKELNASLGPKESEKLKAAPTKNLEAYDLFLKGRHAFNQWGLAGYRAATEYFNQAIAKDPDFKEAYSYLASSYSARMSWNGDLSPGEATKHIDIYLDEAWKRGPTDNDYLTKGFVEFFINKDFKATEKLFLTAIELNTNNAAVLYTYSYLLNMMGRFGEALQWVDKAKVIEPLSVAYFNYQTITLHLMGRNQEALDSIKEGLRLYPSVLRFYDFLARILLSLERWEEAADAVLAGFRTSTLRPPSMVAFLAVAYFRLGKKDENKKLLEELVKRSDSGEMAVNINTLYVFDVTMDFDAAVLYFNKAKQTNDVGLIWWDVDPFFKNIRDQWKRTTVGVASADFTGAEMYINTLLESNMPKLPYHNIQHIRDVLQSAVVIAENEGIQEHEIKLIRLAALLHDAGFIYTTDHHEEKGATMAREILPAYGLSPVQIEAIADMIMATHTPQKPSTHIEKILCDADLDYLGREDFYQTGSRLLEELKVSGVVSTDEEWNQLQIRFLESHHFHTEYSKKHREESKKKRLQEISSQLKAH